MTDWLIDSRLDWLLDWPIDWLIGWSVIDWLIAWCIHWLNDWLVGSSIDRLIDWLAGGWLIGGLVVWLFDWLNHWLVGRLVSLLVEWLNDWLNVWSFFVTVIKARGQMLVVKWLMTMIRPSSAPAIISQTLQSWCKSKNLRYVCKSSLIFWKKPSTTSLITWNSSVTILWVILPLPELPINLKKHENSNLLRWKNIKINHKGIVLWLWRSTTILKNLG